MTSPGGDPGQTPSPESTAGATQPPAGGYEAPSIEYPDHPPAYAQQPPPMAPMAPQYAPPGYPPPPGFAPPGYPPPPGAYPPPQGAYPPPPPYGVPGPGYGTPGYPYGAPAPGANSLAIASLVVSVFWLCGLGSIIGVVLGVIALNQLKTSGETGRGLAIAGIVIGGVSLAFGALYFFAALGSS